MFLRHFLLGSGYISVAIGHVSNESFYKKIEDIEQLIKPGVDIFFAPAVRKTQGNTKEDVLGSRACYVDVDDSESPITVLPPSAKVWSGHGWHLYWFMNEPILDTDTLETLNKILISDIPTADKGAWNANRFLRIPGTQNCKETPVDVEVKFCDAGITYDIADILVLAKLPEKTRKKIKSGDSRGFRSRSERDYAVIAALVQAGASNNLIKFIFDTQPVGDKVQDKETHHSYIDRTIAKARITTSTKPASNAMNGIVEEEDGYHMQGKTSRRISTFTLQPQVLLDGSTYDSEDALVCTVQANGHSWPNVTFTKHAFTSIANLDKQCKVAAWQWLGTDNDVRQLLPHLLEKLKEDGLPIVAATPVMGLHQHKDTPYFLGDKQVLTHDQMWLGYDGPIAWLPNKGEHPHLNLVPVLSDEDRQILQELLPKIYDPGVLWVMCGWYAAACIKPWLKSKGLRFPVLNVVGTKGSGKSSLILNIFMPLFGQIEANTWDANTTKFVILRLLGSSNAIPVAFSEFRASNVNQFLRFILLSYDTGHDARGKSDQSIADYPLTAPFSIDGEDMITDPAAQERMLVAHLTPGVVEEDTPEFEAFKTLEWILPKSFAGYYIQYCLAQMVSGELEKLLARARADIVAAYPAKLPDRIRNNHIVARLGMLLFCDAIQLEAPGSEVLRASISAVCNLETGRSRTLVDEFVEGVINTCNTGGNVPFKWSYDSDSAIIYFQLVSSHAWWIRQRRIEGRVVLERDAIRSQLTESPYHVKPKNIDGVWVYGVDLKLAQDQGLDVPAYLEVNVVKFQF